MITFLSALFGLIGAAFPDCLKLLRDRADRIHELAILDRQMEMMKLGHSQRMEEIQVQADSVESQALYQTWKAGIAWVDALNGSVRPVLAYAFFALYAVAKLIALMQLSSLSIMPAFLLYDTIWGVEDQAIFTGIISFYFGQRAMSKLRHR